MNLMGDLLNTLDRSLVNDNAIQDFQKYFWSVLQTSNKVPVNYLFLK